MDSIQTKNVFVLTGAGFTKNFGGFLATEMWAQIFNDPRIQAHSRLRKLLQDNFDFESVYSTVVDCRTGLYTDEEKAAMRGVVNDSYRRLDDAIRNWKFDAYDAYGVNMPMIQDLFDTIWPKLPAEPAILFTLNQDLLVERWWSYSSLGVRSFNNKFYRTNDTLNGLDFITLPGDQVEEKIKEDLISHNAIHYVKLHGSYGWRSFDNSNTLVIGTNKESLIKKEPLLREYFTLLRGVIAEGNKKVLIIGYGFRDQHINNILLKGVQDNNLRIYVISTEPPENLKYHFERGGHFYAREIFDGLSGYFSYSLKEIFPCGQERTTHFDQLVRALSD